MPFGAFFYFTLLRYTCSTCFILSNCSRIKVTLAMLFRQPFITCRIAKCWQGTLHYKARPKICDIGFTTMNKMIYVVCHVYNILESRRCFKMSFCVRSWHLDIYSVYARLSPLARSEMARIYASLSLRLLNAIGR